MCFGARSFRPLTGKLVLILISDDYWPTLRWSCFRPLTGKLVLIITECAEGMRVKIVTFPSPYGEVGFDLPCGCNRYRCIYEFPSPYGEVGFDLIKTTKGTGSPSKGFRPLTGKLVLIICVVYVLMAIYAHAFPSPYGEVGFDPIENAEAIDSREIEFPSPYGEVGFDLLQVLSDLSLRRHEFPSPYGEVGFDPCTLTI